MLHLKSVSATVSLKSDAFNEYSLMIAFFCLTSINELFFIITSDANTMCWYDSVAFANSYSSFACEMALDGLFSLCAKSIFFHKLSILTDESFRLCPIAFTG